MLTELEQLIALVPPPEAPVHAGSMADFVAIEDKLGSRLPIDFKRLITTYGKGEVGLSFTGSSIRLIPAMKPTGLMARTCSFSARTVVIFLSSNRIRFGLTPADCFRGAVMKMAGTCFGSRRANLMHGPRSSPMTALRSMFASIRRARDCYFLRSKKRIRSLARFRG
jgi:hypothetical protein